MSLCHMLSVADISVIWRGHFNDKGTNANAESEAPKRRKIFTRWLNYKDVYRTAREGIPSAKMGTLTNQRAGGAG